MTQGLREFGTEHGHRQGSNRARRRTSVAVPPHPALARRPRGFVFILGIICLLVMIILGLVSINVAINTRRLASNKERNIRAQAAAEAGAWTAKSTLESLSTTPTTTQSGNDTLPNGATYSYTAVPLTPPTGYPWLFRFLVTSEGKTPDGGDKFVVAQCQPSNFAKYAYCEQKALSGGWIVTGMRYNGPVHSNDTLAVFWDLSSGHPIFGDVVTSAQSSISWYDSAHTPHTTTDWQNIFDGGQSALKLGVKPLTFPTTSRLQRNRAWVGGLSIAANDTTTNPTPALPTTNGVYLDGNNVGKVQAGIYIAGDCSINCLANGTNQEFDITQGTTTWKVIVNSSANTTSVQKTGASSPTVYTGIPNGMIYCSGNVTGIQGTLVDNTTTTTSGTVTGVSYHNAWTVATDVGNNKTITITGNLLYNTQPNTTAGPYDPSNLKAATLGLYGQTVQIAGTQPTYSIDAAVMASNGTGGTWSDANPSYTTGGQPGNMYLTGGVINYQSGLFGYCNASGVIIEGHAEHYTYDPRNAAFPPPFFPSTGLYDITSWQIK